MAGWVPRKKMMVFVDGSNFIAQLIKERSLSCRADKPNPAYYQIAWEILWKIACLGPQPKEIIRAYWFGSYKGNDQDCLEYCKTLRASHFDPVLFRLHNSREKGVDIALTKEMLVNAFHTNFEVGLLVAGDEDYVGLVKEVKRYGASIQGAFFESGLSPYLRLEFDEFYSMTGFWQEPLLGKTLSIIEDRLKGA
ncbi:MAG TPA: NYN domain-containing protein [Syntrophobacteraceae bacterium]|nr:NYN domain-containing protein [Syntrophobacteraceae bacterium]